MMKDQKEKLREKIPFTIATKRIKYLGINLPKETKDLYSENYKVLTKEINDDANQMEGYTMFLDWKKQYCENDYTTQRIYRFNTIPVKLPMAFFIKLEPRLLQF